jgi:hypothetical protein
MGKIKMRCINCGKWFQSANVKEVTCPECLQKARKEKLAAKSTPQTSTTKSGMGAVSSSKQSSPPSPKPKDVTSGTSHWIDAVQDVKIGQPDHPKPKIQSSPVQKDTKNERTVEKSGSRSPGGYHEKAYRSPGDYRSGGIAISGTSGQRPRQSMGGSSSRGTIPGIGDSRRTEGKREGKPAKPKGQKTPTTPKPKREKIPPPAPFTPTPEQVAQVQARYIELAVPTEFDGIRTQISHELGIPKKAVKKIVKELRERESIPSWWELQTYNGSSEELQKIREAYLPHLPLPPIGVHKTIAEELSINPGEVYQAIKAIRLEMNLPQYNDPSLHDMEPITGKKKQSEALEEGMKELPKENPETNTEALEKRSESVNNDENKTKAPESVDIVSSSAVDNNT